MSSPKSLKMSFNMDKLFAKVDNLEHVMQDSVRSAAKAGAQVFYEEAKKLVARSDAKVTPAKRTGLLERSIYQRYQKDQSTPGKNAVYRISWRTGGPDSKGDKGPPLPFAPHGHLIEYGWIQRYQVYVGKDGQWHTAIRPEMRGKKPPSGGDKNRAALDAYYLPRPGGPVQWLPRSFIRAAYTSKRTEALAAVKARMIEKIKEALL